MMPLKNKMGEKSLKLSKFIIKNADNIKMTGNAKDAMYSFISLAIKPS